MVSNAITCNPFCKHLKKITSKFIQKLGDILTKQQNFRLVQIDSICS